MIDLLQSLKLIPIVSLDEPDDAEPLVDALCAGGLPVAEIALRTDKAVDVIRRLHHRDEFLLGAGTVHSAEQAQEAVEAGAAVDETIEQEVRSQPDDVIVQKIKRQMKDKFNLEE